MLPQTMQELFNATASSFIIEKITEGILAI